MSNCRKVELSVSFTVELKFEIDGTESVLLGVVSGKAERHVLEKVILKLVKKLRGWSPDEDISVTNKPRRRRPVWKMRASSMQMENSSSPLPNLELLRHHGKLGERLQGLKAVLLSGVA